MQIEEAILEGDAIGVTIRHTGELECRARDYITCVLIKAALGESCVADPRTCNGIRTVTEFITSSFYLHLSIFVNKDHSSSITMLYSSTSSTLCW
jgi:hypothetical protein